jgi:hypothetical protein
VIYEINVEWVLKLIYLAYVWFDCGLILDV